MPITTTATTGETTPTQKNAVGYAVHHDIQQTSDPTTTGYTVTLTVDGANTLGQGSSDLFARDMLGWSSVPLAGVLSRVLPEPCGRDPRAYCVKLESVMHVPDDLTAGEVTVSPAGWPTYQVESFRATYAIPLYQVKEDDEVTYEHERFCVWRTKVTAQNEKIPGGAYQRVDGTAANRLPLNEVAVKTGRGFELTCKWLDVPFYDPAHLATLMNKINDADVTWNGVTFAENTVLVTGIDAEPRVNGVGDLVYDYTFSFSVKGDGRTWNKFWQRDGTYVEVSTDGTAGGSKPFATADLNELWSVP